jgi:hypothetical protein
MKKSTLAALMVVLVATPCFAQEVEPEGLFTIEGTLWNVCGISISDDQLLNIGCYEMGFDQGTVYSNKDNAWSADERLSYIDTPLVSIAYDLAFVLNAPSVNVFIMQPSGFGVYTDIFWVFGINCLDCFDVGFGMGIMFKVADDWIPKVPEFTISPDQGEPGTTLTDVTITGVNTTFQDDPPVEIFFVQPDGLTVSNIRAINNTEIKFDLQLSAGSTIPGGLKTVVVQYDSGNVILTKQNAFMILF